MEKYQKLESLARFVSSSTCFLRYLETDGKNQELGNDYFSIAYQKVINASFMFFLCKEDIVIKEDNNKFTSDLNKEYLSSFVSAISSKENNGTWSIGECIFTDVLEILHVVRNKLAHGDFKILEDENSILFEHENQIATIDIDKLVDFTLNVCNYWELMKKTGINTRTLVEDTINYKNKITCEKDFLDTLDKCYIIEIKNYPRFPFTRSFEASILIEEMIEKIKRCIANKENYIELIDNYKTILSKQYNIELIIERKSVKSLEENKLLQLKNKYLCCKEEFKNINHYTQCQHIIHWIYELEKAKNTKKNLLFACVSNIAMLNLLEKDKSLTPIDVIKNCNNIENMITYYHNQVVSNYLLNFYTTYQFGLDTIYKNEIRDHLDDILDESKFDFSKLDLSSFHPTINLIEHPSDCYIDQISSINNDYKYTCSTLEEKIQRRDAYLSKNINNINEKTKNKLDYFVTEAGIDKNKKEEHLIDACYFMKFTKEKYIENREIITHIRNSIAHGNVEIDMFNGDGGIFDTLLTFKDIYEGKLTFELKIKLKDFNSLFNKNNLEVLYSYINNSYNKEQVNKNIIKSKSINSQ